MINCSANNSPPCYGIFWALGESESDLTESNLFCVTEPYAANDTDEKPVFNHKRFWQTLDKKITRGKPFDYFPRGRGEIRNGKATIWLNVNILHLADKTIEIYSLSSLTEVRVKVDGSKHYNSHFD